MWKFHPYQWWQTQRNEAFLVRSHRLTMEGWWGFDNLFFLFSLFYFSSPRYLLICQRNKGVLLFCFCVKRGPHSFDCYFFFALDPFLKLNFIFNFILRYWLVNKLGFMICFMGWFRSHDLGHGFERLTQVNINLFLYYFLHVFYFSILSFNIRFI